MTLHSMKLESQPLLQQWTPGASGAYGHITHASDGDDSEASVSAVSRNDISIHAQLSVVTIYLLLVFT